MRLIVLSALNRRGSPYPHRYKYPEQRKVLIDLVVFRNLMDRVEVVDRHGYSAQMIQAAHAVFFWTGWRASEILGRKAVGYRVDCPLCFPKGVKRGAINASCSTCGGTGRITVIGRPHPGIVREDIEYRDGFLLVRSVDQNVLKHGKREEPYFMHESQPYVNTIKAQWEGTPPGKRLFPISRITFWRICKAIDPKFTMHFYRHNRTTELSGDEEVSLNEICSQLGVTPQTAADYMARAGRFAKKLGEHMRKKYGSVPSLTAVEELEAAARKLEGDPGRAEELKELRAFIASLSQTYTATEVK